MNKKAKIVILLAVFLLVCAFMPAVASADEDDINVGHTRTTPENAGSKGGDISLLVYIQNQHSEAITWVDITTGTATPQTQRWTGSDGVPPYTQRTARITIHLENEDLRKDLNVAVALNFDGDANPDKVVFKTINVGISDIVGISTTPAPGEYEVGDTITVTHELINIGALRLIDVTFQSFFLGNEDQHLVDSPVTTDRSVSPSDTVRSSTTYTLRSSDVGTVTGAYSFEYTYLGETYSKTGFAYSYNVTEAPSPPPTPEPEPTPEPTPSPEAAASPSPSPSAAAFETAQPTADAAPTQTDGEPNALLTSVDSADSQATGQQGSSSTVLYIVIGVLAALIVAGAVAVPLIVRKRRGGKK